jgi:DNA repair exonuclease SbcCD ATPase subunit
MPDAAQEAREKLERLRALLAHSQKIQTFYDEYMAEFDERIAQVEKERAYIQRKFDEAPGVIADYEEKVRQQQLIIKHVKETTKVTGQRAHGGVIRTMSPIEKLRNLRKQMAKIQHDLDHPEGDGPKDAGQSGKFDQIKNMSGVKFMRDRQSKLWYFSDIAGGTVYGPFDKFSEARENASV